MTEQREAITFNALQHRFAQLWDDGKILPESVTISEKDYIPFAESTMGTRPFDDFERWLLGEDRIAELEYRRSPARNITHVINHVNSGMVRLIRDPHLPTGTLSFGYYPASWEVEP